MLIFLATANPATWFGPPVLLNSETPGSRISSESSACYTDSDEIDPYPFKFVPSKRFPCVVYTITFAPLLPTSLGLVFRSELPNGTGAFRLRIYVLLAIRICRSR